MSEVDWDSLTELAGKVAKEVADKWPCVDADDVQQEIMVHLLEEPHNLHRYVGDEELLRKVCWNAGRRYAAKERAWYDLMDDQYYYTPEEARIALRSFVYTDEEIGKMIGKHDDLTKCVISDNIITARADASVALGTLNERYRNVLMRVFVYGLQPNSEAERRMSYRAVDALAMAMNRHIRTKG